MQLKEGVEGVTLKLKVKPKARRNAVLGVHGDALRVSVTAAAEKGKANQACIALLAQTLGVPKSHIEILTGETHSEKVIRVRGLTSRQIQERLGVKVRIRSSWGAE
jgi:hypothetical protein